ncbi:MAG: SLC13 family permease [Candidatus Fermentibacteria bacterium]|nr:SLC13 family permease [Candidatus Fermentibacteria bacterium]
MDGAQYFVVAILAAIVVLLYSRKLSPSVIFLSAAAVLAFSGIISPSEALAGFGNEAIAAMIMLLILSQIIWKTGFVQWIFEVRLKPSNRYRVFLAQMMPFVGGSSAFMNNTPVVAMMIPFVSDWGSRHNIPASKLLMPLSWAAILGGMVTLIGTSTNMIVNSLVVGAGGKELSILDFTPVGLMVFIGGMGYVLLLGYRTLPLRKSPSEKLADSPREYISSLIVHPDSDLVGKTVESASLRSLKDLFLVEILRGDSVIAPVVPAEVLEAGDQLLLAGNISAVAELAAGRKGLSLAGEENFPEAEKINVVKVVVSPGSSFIGMKVKNSNFRGRFDAAILAVHSQGKRQEGKIGDMKLRSGDLLLLVTGEDFAGSTGDIGDFLVISMIKQIHNIDLKKSIFITTASFSCILLSIFGIVPLFNSLLALIAVFLILRIVSSSELKQMINMDLLVIAAFALAVGKAVQVTDLGDLLAGSVVSWFEPLGVVGVLAAVYITTNILAELITTTAAATIVFPFAAASAAALGVDGTPFYLAVAYGAAANFITPVGYQTNLMIYGPGGYRINDFLKAGLPLKLLCAVIAILGLSLVHGFL